MSTTSSTSASSTNTPSITLSAFSTPTQSPSSIATASIDESAESHSNTIPTWGLIVFLVVVGAILFLIVISAFLYALHKLHKHCTAKVNLLNASDTMHGK